MLNIGMTLTPALEDFTPAQKSAANHLPVLFAKAQDEGSLTDDIKESLEKTFKRITGLDYKITVVDELNAAVQTVISLNTGGVNNLDTKGISNKEADEAASWCIRELGSTIVHKPLYYNQATGHFEGAALKELTFKLYFGIQLLDTLTADEITAVMLHEVGHSWIMVRDLGVFYDQSIITTSAMLITGRVGEVKDKVKIDLVQQVLNRLDKQKHPEVYKKIESGNYTKKEFVKACMLINDDIQMNSMSLAGSGGMNRRNEQAADYYPIRLGFGGPLSTGLRKIGSTAYDGTRVALSSLSQLLMMTVGCANVVLAPPLGILLVVCTIVIASEDLYSTYDNNTARHKRIFRTLIDELKRSKRRGDDEESLKIQIKTLTELQEYVDNKWDDAGWLQFLNPIYIRNYLGRKQEERIEGLMNNPLFVSALKLEYDI